MKRSLTAMGVMAALWATVLLTPCVLTSCSKPRPARPRAAPPEVAATGCGLSGQRTGDFHLQASDGNGTSRDYEVIVPENVEPSRPLALTFVYHGAGGTQAAAKAFGLQNAPGAAAASIFVFPQGIPFQKYGVGWDDACDGYDMVLFDNMLARLETDYCIDKRAIFAAGFSWGCDHVTTLSCCRGNRVRAIAGGSCSDEFTDPAKASTYANLPCPAAGHTAIRFSFDPAGDGVITARYFASTVELYRSFNSCAASTTPIAESQCVSFNGCTNPFVECPYPGLGHALPANWADETWRFFASRREQQ